MIDGYAEESSAYPGDAITFRIATDAPEFRIEFYRQGATFDAVGYVTDWLAGVPGEPHEADQDFGEAATRRDGKTVDGWSAYPFQVPDWESGVYVAMFVEGDGNGQPNPNQTPPLDRSTPDARSGKALFVVKNASPGYASQILYKLPLFTYQMYNMTEYQGIDGQDHAGAGYPFLNYHTGEVTGALWVTLHRPGGGTGGTPWDSVYYGPLNPDGSNTGNLDVFDPTLRQTFVHWDAKMIAWLEGNGYQVDYCTDLDIHRDDAALSLLSPYSLLLSVGHDEYYSQQMRGVVPPPESVPPAGLKAFRAAGGNIAFFSGNTSYWRLVFPVIDDQGQVDERFITRDGQWAGLGRPEDELTGVGFRHAGERDYPLPDSDATKIGYTVQNTFTWPFENSTLGENDTFGHDLCIVGYECDGAPYNHNAPRPVSPAPGDGTPANLMILGTAPLTAWPGGAEKAATIAMYSDAGTVFTGGTTDWPRLLASGDGPTTTITANVVNRLGGNPKGLAELASLVQTPVACDGFFTAEDNYRHAIVAASDGTITEVPFSPVSGPAPGFTGLVQGVLDIAAFASDNDRLRHLVAIDSNGGLWDAAWDAGINQPQLQMLANLPGATRVAGFYTGDDELRHAIVSTSAGDLLDVSYAGGQAPDVTAQSLGSFAGLVDLGGFWSPDDEYRHAIVAAADGTITEIFFHPDKGVFQTPIAVIPDVARLSAYYAAGDRYFNRRAQALTSAGRIHEVRYTPQAGIIRVVLFNPGPLVDLGGFYTADDDYRHSILATPAGDLQELFYKP